MGDYKEHFDFEQRQMEEPDCSLARAGRLSNLTPNQRRLVVGGWKKDNFNWLFQIGIRIYSKIFEVAPAAKSLFHYVVESEQRGLDIRDSKKFRGQALRFVQVMSQVVAYVERPKTEFDNDAEENLDKTKLRRRSRSTSHRHIGTAGTLVKTCRDDASKIQSPEVQLSTSISTIKEDQDPSTQLSALVTTSADQKNHPVYRMLFDIGWRHKKIAANQPLFSPDLWDVYEKAMDGVMEEEYGRYDNLSDEEKRQAVEAWKHIAGFIIDEMKIGFYSKDTIYGVATIAGSSSCKPCCKIASDQSCISSSNGSGSEKLKTRSSHIVDFVGCFFKGKF